MFKKIFPILALSALPFTTSYAQDSDSKFYGGLKLGSMAVDESSIQDEFRGSGISVSVKDGTAFGLQLGYATSDTFGVELEYLSGDADIKASGFGVSGSETIDITTIAIYGAYRSGGDFYFLGKLGLLSEDISFEGFSESDQGLSLGIGGGFRFSQGSVELEYTIIEEDVNFLGLTGRLNF